MYNESAAKESDDSVVLVLERWKRVGQSHWIEHILYTFIGPYNAIVVAGTPRATSLLS